VWLILPYCLDTKEYQYKIIFFISEWPVFIAISIASIVFIVDYKVMRSYQSTNLWRSIKLSCITGFAFFTSAIAINAILAYLGHTPTVLFVGSGNVYNFLHDTNTEDCEKKCEPYKATLKFGWEETANTANDDIPLTYFLEMGSSTAEQVLTRAYIHQNDSRERKHLPVLALIAKKADYTPDEVIKKLPPMGNGDASFFALKLNSYPRFTKACLLSHDKKCEEIPDISIEPEYTYDKWVLRILEIKKNNLVFGLESPDSGSTTKSEVLKAFQEHGYDLKKEGDKKQENEKKENDCEPKEDNKKQKDGKYKFKCVNDSKFKCKREYNIISSSPLKAPDLDDDDKYAVLFASDFSDDYDCVKENALSSPIAVDYYLVGYIEYPVKIECGKSKCIGYLDASTCSVLNQLLGPEKVTYKGFGKTRCYINIHDESSAAWGKPEDE